MTAKYDECYLSGFSFVEPDSDGRKLFPGMIITDRDHKTLFSLPTDHAPHSLFTHPSKQNLILLMSKNATVSSLLDLHSNENRIFEATEGAAFYGHGQFIGGGDYFVTTERRKNYRGLLVIRETSSLKIVETFPLNGLSPHDCFVLPDNILAVVLTGIMGDEGTGFYTGTSQLQMINLDSGKVIDVMKPDKKEFALGHLSISTSGDVAVLMASEGNHGLSGLLSVGKLGGPLKSVKFPKGIFQRPNVFTLSLLIDEDRKRVVITNTMGCMVTCWDLETGEYLFHENIPFPLGVTFDLNKRNYLITANHGFSYSIDPRTFKVSAIHSVDQHGRFEAHTLLRKTNGRV